VFSNKEKLAFIRKSEQSSLPRAAFERAEGLPASSMVKWKVLQRALAAADPAGLSAKGAANRRLELELLRWLTIRWQWKGYRVSAQMIQAKARSIARLHGDHEFVGTSGWWGKFRRRNGLKTVRMHGERASADHEAAKAYPARFQEIVNEYNIPQTLLFNAHKTLFSPRIQLPTTVCPEHAATARRAVDQRALRGSSDNVREKYFCRRSDEVPQRLHTQYRPSHRPPLLGASAK
jgi:hypothetical protein